MCSAFLALWVRLCGHIHADEDLVAIVVLFVWMARPRVLSLSRSLKDLAIILQEGWPPSDPLLGVRLGAFNRRSSWEFISAQHLWWRLSRELSHLLGPTTFTCSRLPGRYTGRLWAQLPIKDLHLNWHVWKMYWMKINRQPHFWDTVWCKKKVQK